MSANASGPDASLLQQLDLVAILAMARRHARVIGVSAMIGLTLSVAYAVIAQPQYTATVSVLIGSRQLRTVQDISAQTSPVTEASLVDSEAEALRSERVLLNTIRTMKLTADPDFNGTGDPFLEKSWKAVVRWTNPLNWLIVPPPPSDPAYRMERLVLNRLLGSIKVARVGRSNVLQVIVTVPSARKSADIANGIADAYLAEQLASRYEAARRAGLWFQKRIDELRDQSAAAQNLTEKFRAENNLLAAGGQLVSDQQLQQLATEYALANGDRVRKQARYDSLRAIIERGSSDDLVTEALGNSIITQLRQRFGDVSKRYNENIARLGVNHEQVQNLRKQMAEFERLIFEELKRIESTYRNELDVALEREKALSRNLESLKSVTTTANTSLVQLRQLEQESSSLKGLYQSFLQRYQETIQQESFPINDARIISDGAPPLVPSEPRKGLLVALGLLLGLGVGVGIGALRELGDRGYRSPRQIEEDLGLPVLGSLPLVGAPSAVARNRSDSARNLANVGKLADTSPPVDVTRFSIDYPFSSYAEALRSVKVSFDTRFDRMGGKVIGIVSTLPREGKSVVSKNLASLLALQGARVALIDGDLRRAGLSKFVAPDVRIGLVEVLQRKAVLAEVLITEPQTGLTILPAVVREDFFQSAELLASANMEILLQAMSKNYDYIVIDLPPLAPITDALAACHLIDAFLLVVEWGNVPSRVVRDTMQANAAVAEKMIGVVLNKVEVDKMRLYQPYGLDEKQTQLLNQYYK